MGTAMDSSGTPSKSGIAFWNPCQWMVCPSVRSGRTDSPRLVNVILMSVSWSKPNNGALICAWPRCAVTFAGDRPVTSRKPKTYMLVSAGAIGSGQNGAMCGALSGIETQPSVAARCTSALGFGTAAGTRAGARRGPALELPSGSSAQLARPAAPANRDRRGKARGGARAGTGALLRAGVVVEGWGGWGG